MDRTKTSALIGGAAVRVAGAGTVQLLLPAATGVGGEPEIHAAAGPRIHAAPILRGHQNDPMAARARLCGGTQTSAAVATNDGFDGDLRQAAFEPERGGAPAIPLSVRGRENPAGQPGLERGHYLCSTARGVCVFGGGVGLVQPVCVGLGAIEQLGSEFLRGRLGTGAGPGTTRDIQHRPRCAVYQPAVPGAAAQTGLRQYFRFYNEERYHQGLNYRTPRNVYLGAK